MITFALGDITDQPDIQGIVTSAKRTLLGGGGVDGVIHKKAGIDLVQECIRVRKRRFKGDLLPAKTAIVTKAYNLPNEFVVHTTAPKFGVDTPEEEYLRESYRSTFKAARKKKIRSIAFPSLGTGTYGCPVDWASEIAIKEAMKFETTFDEIRFVLFTKSDRSHVVL